MGGVQPTYRDSSRERACKSKVPFATKATALMGIKRYEKLARRNCKKAHVVIDAYKCIYCPFWHLTHRR